MKRLLYSLSGLGLVSILVMGTSAGDSSADQARSPLSARSPLRGTWSFSQVVPTTTAFAAFGVPPIPMTAVGILIMDEGNSFTAHGVFNNGIDPKQGPGPALELDLNGACTVRNGNISNGLDCLLNVPSFGLSERRFCVVMANDNGQCFDEFRCVDTDLVGTVLLVEYKRQQLGTCK